MSSCATNTEGEWARASRCNWVVVWCTSVGEARSERCRGNSDAISVSYFIDVTFSLADNKRKQELVVPFPLQHGKPIYSYINEILILKNKRFARLTLNRCKKISVASPCIENCDTFKICWKMTSIHYTFFELRLAKILKDKRRVELHTGISGIDKDGSIAIRIGLSIILPYANGLFREIRGSHLVITHAAFHDRRRPHFLASGFAANHKSAYKLRSDLAS